MTSSAEVTAARADIARARTQISNTITEITDRFAAPVRTVKAKVNVAQAVNDHPWIAVTAALGAGVLLATSGADERAATAVASTAKQVGTSGVRLAKEAPSKTRMAVSAMVDSVAAKLAKSLIGSLRDSPDRSKVEVRTGARFANDGSSESATTTQL